MTDRCDDASQARSGSCADAPGRLDDIERNKILNQCSGDLWNIVTDNDPEAGTLNNRVWDRLDEMACEIEARAAAHTAEGDEPEDPFVAANKEAVSRHKRVQLLKDAARIISAYIDEFGELLDSDGRDAVEIHRRLLQAARSHQGEDTQPEPEDEDLLTEAYLLGCYDGRKPEVKVKRLEWAMEPPNRRTAEGLGRAYGIAYYAGMSKPYKVLGGWLPWSDDPLAHHFDTLEQAQQACQDDYDKRVMSAVEVG